MKKNLLIAFISISVIASTLLTNESAQAKSVTLTSVSSQIAKDLTALYKKNLIVNQDGTLSNNDALGILFLKAAKSHRGYPAAESDMNKQFYQINDKEKNISCVYPNILSYERMILSQFKQHKINAETQQAQLAAFTNKLTFAYRLKSCKIVAAREAKELPPVFAQIGFYLKKLNNPRTPNGSTPTP